MLACIDTTLEILGVAIYQGLSRIWTKIPCPDWRASIIPRKLKLFINIIISGLQYFGEKVNTIQSWTKFDAGVGWMDGILNFMITL